MIGTPAETDRYAEATARNLGLLTEAEQETLRSSTVAIAGMGAVGGHYLLALARLGVGGFRIADPDSFEIANLHRQAGAFSHTLGRGKAATMAEMARAVNPGIRIEAMERAVTGQNVDEFLEGAGLVLDGIEFFQVDAHRALADGAQRRGLHTIVSGPIGYGASLHVFAPGGMSFDDYFGIAPDLTRAERIAAFAQGLVPGLPGGGVDPSRVDFEREKGPALISAVMLCTGIATTEVLRILLGRGASRCVPETFYFDPYARSYTRGTCVRGRWRDRLVRWLAFKRYPGLQRLHDAERSATDYGERTART
jgi:molybdopterin/thiamine biosynthesis adenylyltransferase